VGQEGHHWVSPKGRKVKGQGGVCNRNQEKKRVTVRNKKDISGPQGEGSPNGPCVGSKEHLLLGKRTGGKLGTRGRLT